MSTLPHTATPQGWDKAAPAFSAMGAVFANKVSHPGAIGLFDSVIPDISKVPNDAKVLDVAAGAGSLAVYAAQKLKERNGTVVATDFAPALIDVLKKNVEAAGITNLQSDVMDGQNLKFDANTFDYAFSVWGLIFFPDQDKGLSELYRVIKPGGKAGIATWTTRNLSIEICFDIAKKLGKDYPTPAFLQMSTEDALQARLIKAGFKDVVVHELPVDFNLQSAEGFVKMMENNPATEDNMQILGLTKEEFCNYLTEGIKQKHPEMPAKSTQIALVGYGTK